MKKYPFLEAIGTVDEKFLEEALNDSKEQERRQISMNKRKTVTIMIAAALIFTMAATAVAAGISKISTLGGYFEDNKEYFRLPDEVPMMNNPEDYANEVTTEVTTATQSENVKGVVDATGAVDTYTPPAPGEAKIVAVSATEYSLFMTVEVNVAGLNIPKELPEDSSPTGQYYFGYEGHEQNFRSAFSRMEMISYEDDIMTFVMSWDGHICSEDELVVKLSQIGYTAYSEPDAEGHRSKDFKAVADLEIELRLPVSELNIMEPIKSSNTAKLIGADYSVELSPYELVLCTSMDSLIAAGYDLESEEGIYEFDKVDMELFNSIVELHMLDGTEVRYDPMSYDFHLYRSGSGFRDYESRQFGRIFFLNVPIDTTQIDYIMVDDARFDFAH